MVSALSAQGNRPYARFVCRRRSFLCLISLQRRNSLLATRHSPLSFSRIMFRSNPFRSNTYKTFCKCSFQKTYSRAKSFRMRTYKKPGGGDPIHYLVTSLGPCPLWSRRRAVGAPLFSHGNFALCLFSSYRYQTPPVTTRGVHPLPSFKRAFPRDHRSVPRCLCGFPAQPKLMQEILCYPHLARRRCSRPVLADR